MDSIPCQILTTSAHEPIISSTRGYSLRVGFTDDEAYENEKNSSNIHCGGVGGAEVASDMEIDRDYSVINGYPIHPRMNHPHSTLYHHHHHHMDGSQTRLRLT